MNAYQVAGLFLVGIGFLIVAPTVAVVAYAAAADWARRRRGLR